MGLERHDAIVRYIAKTARLDAQLLHRSTHIDFGSWRNLQRGVVTLQNLKHASAVNGLHLLTLLRLAEAGGDHLCQVLLLLVVLVELLNTLHLLAPPRC